MPKFKDLRKIGSGGFGNVWTCQNMQTGSICAKKILSETTDEDCLKRFAREVRILASLDHPNIIRVIGRRLNSPPYYYTMPVYSRSLRVDVPALTGDHNRIKKIFEAIIDGLDYAHEQGVVHRDLKPENILLNNDDDIVISDFGLGRVIDTASTRQTQVGFGLGTPLYMAPEQIMDARNADARSDIFSVGRMLYEMHTGPLTTAIQNLDDVSPAVASVIERCTRAKPDDRFQSVGELKATWRLLHDISSRKSQKTELAKLAQKFTSPAPMANADVNRVLELLAAFIDDADFVHEMMMSINANHLGQLHRVDPSSTRNLVNAFCDFNTSQGWPFDYTDKIANQCLSLFDSTTDAAIRVSLTLCCFEVGVGHHRWRVMERVGTMLSKIQEPVAILALFENLNQIPKGRRDTVVPYLELAKIDPTIRKLFESEKGEN